MIGIERTKDVISVIYNINDRIYSIDELTLLVYLIEDKYCNNDNSNNMKITNLNWIKRGGVVEDDLYNKGVIADARFIDAVSNIDYENRENLLSK